MTWTNKDTAQHNAVGQGAADFDTGLLEKGENASVPFNDTGTFRYVCTVHAGMKGEVEGRLRRLGRIRRQGRHQHRWHRRHQRRHRLHVPVRHEQRQHLPQRKLELERRRQPAATPARPSSRCSCSARR